ncbi:hypothetical protein [Herminiimonas aquatilis]|uniref:DUF4124 domain-containing protein n=1 Tax=Herminiimonas aquatilis TaxID=345342 RepID=A0ABW2J3P4_9BURK
MAKHLRISKLATALSLMSIATLACADVVRCENNEGDVTYTDSVCGGVQSTQFILQEKPPSTVTYQQPSKPVAVRSRSWTNTNIVPRKGKVDTESVRSARLKMISMDNRPRDGNLPKYQENTTAKN